MNRTAMTVAAGFLIMVAGQNSTGEEYQQPVDRYSYNLGILGGFAEVVKLGVKTLALSEVMTAEEMDRMMHDAQVVAARNGVKLYRESDLLVTDLYPANVATGKDVLLIYTGTTLHTYLAIKADKAALLAQNAYNAAAREEIARRFGRLLSYPDSVIDELIAKQRK